MKKKMTHARERVIFLCQSERWVRISLSASVVVKLLKFQSVASEETLEVAADRVFSFSEEASVL